MNKLQQETFDKAFDTWLESRPQKIKDLAKKYPPGMY